MCDYCVKKSEQVVGGVGVSVHLANVFLAAEEAERKFKRLQENWESVRQEATETGGEQGKSPAAEKSGEEKDAEKEAEPRQAEKPANQQASQADADDGLSGVVEDSGIVVLDEARNVTKDQSSTAKGSARLDSIGVNPQTELSSMAASSVDVASAASSVKNANELCSPENVEAMGRDRDKELVEIMPDIVEDGDGDDVMILDQESSVKGAGHTTR